MKFESTRNTSEYLSPTEAVIKGLSDDGGLFVPEDFPQIYNDILFDKSNYRELAEYIIGQFFTNLKPKVIKKCVKKSYGKRFANEDVAPLRHFDNFSVLELFHGPTLAFKDMALTLMPYLMKESLKKNEIDKRVLILTATSGDTGKAALEGFKNVDGVDIIVFFPENGVSDIQKLQMRTQKGKNLSVVGIKGNFDDAQNGVKEIFSDPEFKAFAEDRSFILSSANSINIGRLIPQIIYYFNSYRILVNDGEIRPGDKINFCVPTGNFGNILAGYYAKRMGLPINKLICASNENNVLYNFFASGEYDKNRDLILTSSPSMDILISSNLERLLYEISDRDSEKVSQLMKSLKENGSYKIDEKMMAALKDFESFYVEENEVAGAIKEVYDKYSYVIDTHTAVAYKSYEKYKSTTNDKLHTVVLSTASPFKFSKDVLQSLTLKEFNDFDAFEIIDILSNDFQLEIPRPLKKLRNSKIRHLDTIDKSEMNNYCKKYIKGEL